MERAFQRQKALTRSRHGRHNLERGHDAIAGRGEISTNNVSGCLASQRPTPLRHLFEHVAVSHLCTHQFYALVRQRLLQTQIGHQGADHTFEVAVPVAHDHWQ